LAAALYADAILIDTSATVAVMDTADPLHADARDALEELNSCGQYLLCAVDSTAHESFTRIRYNSRLETALAGYSWLRTEQIAKIRTIDFSATDEDKALALIRRYPDVRLSFHDALCAAVMLRLGIYRIFSFDADFWTFGFELLPGTSRRR